ncbi:DUF1810 domain-containing protein [Jatrophihabitans telluris]|uniref:DUF1810 domain-containing protein n=1 Tax=Jatrophihabitans telluris TaxID=2038343 RepID=A0ABY4R315_9ACTN|nr:DUF1810 domain-containing protein [Jatrophihabitans telluris]UQX90218.1 DUF1810 domain-containing protein [Jatrophihabitans telluris]
MADHGSARFDAAGFDADRFVLAQDEGATYSRALAELRAGRKVSHWMWFVFPQIRGLGSSAMAHRYAISSLDQARAYLSHPVLGRRLREAVAALLADGKHDAVAVLGSVDAMKLRSSMTLFARAGVPGDVFQTALDRFFAGEEDPATLALLDPPPERS